MNIYLIVLALHNRHLCCVHCQIIQCVTVLQWITALVPTFVSSIMNFVPCRAGTAACKPNSAEWQVWKKSLQCPGFPHRNVIDEFLLDKDKLPVHALVWKRPKMFHLMVMNVKFVDSTKDEIWCKIFLLIWTSEGAFLWSF